VAPRYPIPTNRCTFVDYRGVEELSPNLGDGRAGQAAAVAG